MPIGSSGTGHENRIPPQEFIYNILSKSNIFVLEKQTKIYQYRAPQDQFTHTPIVAIIDQQRKPIIK